jgi:hypothetical protein
VLKKLLISIVLGTVLAGGMSLIAQEIPPAQRSEFYYVNVLLEKIYPYPKGYVVQYRKGINQMVTRYLPLEWFQGTVGKGEIIHIGSGTSWPSLTVYYRNGEFSHVRLYVRREITHATWGNIPQNINIDDRFENVDDLKLEF